MVERIVAAYAAAAPPVAAAVVSLAPVAPPIAEAPPLAVAPLAAAAPPVAGAPLAAETPHTEEGAPLAVAPLAAEEPPEGAVSLSPGWMRRSINPPKRGEPSILWQIPVFEAGAKERRDDEGNKQFAVRCLLPGCGGQGEHFWERVGSLARCWCHLKIHHGLTFGDLVGIAADPDKKKELLEHGRQPLTPLKRRGSISGLPLGPANSCVPTAVQDNSKLQAKLTASFVRNLGVMANFPVQGACCNARSGMAAFFKDYEGPKFVWIYGDIGRYIGIYRNDIGIY